MNLERKIALVTFYKSNYGSILQCFATKKFCELLGYECDVLDSEKKESFIKKFLSVLKHPSIISQYNRQKKSYKIRAKFLSSETNFLLDQFVEKLIKPKFVSKSELESCMKEYEYIITGSDQVWNASLKVSPFFFLNFVPHEKRIALATSFGISEIPQYNRRALRKALNGFNYISVREETGVEIVKKYSKTSVCRVADPTFIYNADEWRAFAKDAKVFRNNYVLVHFLNEPNQTALESINWLSEHLDLDVVAVGFNHDKLKNISRFFFVDGGPWEYISLIDNADYILTDSFHSTLFSINLNKCFFTFDRQYSASKQTSRITDLLKRFNLENRLIENTEVLKKIYLDKLPEHTQYILEKERIAVRDYIQKIVTGQIPQSLLKGE